MIQDLSSEISNLSIQSLETETPPAPPPPHNVLPTTAPHPTTNTVICQFLDSATTCVEHLGSAASASAHSLKAIKKERDSDPDYKEDKRTMVPAVVKLPQSVMPCRWSNYGEHALQYELSSNGGHC